MYTQILIGLVRHALGAIGAAGAVSDDEISRLVGAVFVLISVGWSVWQKVQAARVVAAPAPLPPPFLPVVKYGKRDR